MNWSEGWLTVGTARLALRDYKEALLAFLHVPVYTPDRALLMSPALLGSAEALIGLDDGPRAQAALKKLLADYPNSAEAATARERLQMLQARPPKRGGRLTFRPVVSNFFSLTRLIPPLK